MRILFIALLILGISSMVEAKCLRCDIGVLVCEGDSKFDAINRCGQPDYSEETSMETRGSTRRGNIDLSEQKVEKLYYNCGSGMFVEILTVKGGKIVSIAEGDRGSGPSRCQ